MTTGHQMMIDAGRRMLATMDAVDAARDARDRALATRYRELQATGLRRKAILARIHTELEETFTGDELVKISVSDSTILAAVRWIPA